MLGFSYSIGLSVMSALFRVPKRQSLFHFLVDFVGYLNESGIASQMHKKAPDAAVNLLVLVQESTSLFKSNETVQTSDLEEGKIKCNILSNHDQKQCFSYPSYSPKH